MSELSASKPSELFSVEGMVVCITGGGTGIGQMMTKAFADNGARRVYIVGRRREKLDETAKINPRVIVPIIGDVTSKESLCEMADFIEQDAGYLNLLCCNSGYMEPTIGVTTFDVPVSEYRRKALTQDVEEWNKTFSTNCTSIAFSIYACLDLLDAGNKKGNCPGRKSQVIVTSSIAGYSRVPALVSAYAASKAAATHMVKQFAGALVPYSIRVNGLAPGIFPSDLAAPIMRAGSRREGKDHSEEGAYDKSFIPAERMGAVDEIVGYMLYMASPAASYQNGNVMVLDGGRLSQLPATY